MDLIKHIRSILLVLSEQLNIRPALYKLKLTGDAMLSPIFFKQKPAKTIALLSKKDKVWYASMLCKEIDCTYPHMLTILQMFEEQGLVETEEQGRIKIIRLTGRGEDLAHDINNLLRRMDK